VLFLYEIDDALLLDLSLAPGFQFGATASGNAPNNHVDSPKQANKALLCGW
jgi:hypothetical protein